MNLRGFLSGVLVLARVLTPLFLLFLLNQVGGGAEIFSEHPESTTVLVDRSVTFECATHKADTTLTIPVKAPSGQQVTVTYDTFDLPNGGIKVTATFNVTKELNGTVALCIAVIERPSGKRPKIHKTDPATAYAYSLSDHVNADNIRAEVNQLGQLVLISWNSVFSPNGINISYRFTDNKGLDTITNTPCVLFYYNNEMEKLQAYSILGHTTIKALMASQYIPQLYTANCVKPHTANITVIANATAANQTGYENVTNLTFKLNCTAQPLVLNCDTDSRKAGGSYKIDCKTHKLDCIKGLFKNTTLICKASGNDSIKSHRLRYMKNIIHFTIHLSPRQRYDCALHFDYHGKKIISQPSQISTHEIQDITIVKSSNALCLQFQLIHGWRIKTIRLDLERGGNKKLFRKIPVAIPENKTTFEKCFDKIAYSSNAGRALIAYDADEPASNPAIKLIGIELVSTPTNGSPNINLSSVLILVLLFTLFLQ